VAAIGPAWATFFADGLLGTAIGKQSLPTACSGRRQSLLFFVFSCPIFFLCLPTSNKTQVQKLGQF
jgi:hypothetical protein